MNIYLNLKIFILCFFASTLSYANCSFSAQEKHELNVYNYAFVQMHSAVRGVARAKFAEQDLKKNFLKKIAPSVHLICGLESRIYILEEKNKEVGLIALKFKNSRDRDVFRNELNASQGRINNIIMKRYEMDVIGNAIFLYYGTYSFINSKFRTLDAQVANH